MLSRCVLVSALVIAVGCGSDRPGEDDGTNSGDGVAQVPGGGPTQPGPMQPGQMGMNPIGDPTVTGGAGDGSLPPMQMEDPIIDPGMMEPPAGDYVPTCEMEVEFRAHGAQVPGDTSPYQVGVALDKYVEFHFNAPWTQTMYALATYPEIDNDQAIHHWLMYMNDGEVQDGAIGGSGSDLGRQLMAGWAPGGSDQIMPQGVGMELKPTSYTMQMHYNSNNPNAPDRSGARVCVTSQMPDHIAIQHWLGTVAIFGTSATGTCKPSLTEPSHLVSVSPHMHKKGTHMKAVVNRADGSQEILHDEPFSFEAQIGYDKVGWEINPGDSITTTCTFNAYSQFGEGTGDEMCFLFVTAYPAGSLTTGGGGLGFQNGCGLTGF